MDDLDSSLLRPCSLSASYPPYHRGSYLEEYFSAHWREARIQSTRQYIDVFWTNIFSNTEHKGLPYPDLQPVLDQGLDTNQAYFTVCQFDDGPLERLPDDTTIFSAGCNRRHGRIVPIPLICSAIPPRSIPRVQQTVFASFVGSLTHPIRDELIACYNGNTSYRFHFTPWTPLVSIGSLRFFLDTTASSRFTLCPRGYGPASFRLYEAMQLGSVPVYISDHHVLPWSDELDWEEFCVVIDEKNITDLNDTLMNISDERYEYMRRRSRELYEDYFTLQGVTANILKRIEC